MNGFRYHVDNKVCAKLKPTPSEKINIRDDILSLIEQFVTDAKTANVITKKLVKKYSISLR